MKKMMILGAVITMIFSACGAGSSTPKTELDSLAYAVGMDFGNYVKNVDSTLNVDIIAAGIKAVLNDNPKIDKDSAYAFMRDYFMVRKPFRVKEASNKFLQEEEKANKKIKKTASGLMYELIEEGDTEVMPTTADQVRVIYEGRLKDGKVFDSSIQRGDTAQFSLSQVIPGWSEGLTLVGKGGKIKLWIPSELGYGAQGAGQAIGPNEALVFDVELIDVLPAEE